MYTFNLQYRDFTEEENGRRFHGSSNGKTERWLVAMSIKWTEMKTKILKILTSTQSNRSWTFIKQPSLIKKNRFKVRPFWPWSVHSFAPFSRQQRVPNIEVLVRDSLWEICYKRKWNRRYDFLKLWQKFTAEIHSKNLFKLSIFYNIITRTFISVLNVQFFSIIRSLAFC